MRLHQEFSKDQCRVISYSESTTTTIPDSDSKSADHIWKTCTLCP